MNADIYILNNDVSFLVLQKSVELLIKVLHLINGTAKLSISAWTYMADHMMIYVLIISSAPCAHNINISSEYHDSTSMFSSWLDYG